MSPRSALDGIRVLELGRVPPAELPGMMLSDMGADVIKIETPGNATPFTDAQRRDAAHAYTNRNKRSIALNLKAAEGVALFLDMARKADVIVEGFRPGVMDRLGIGYQQVRAINPRLVYCSLSGFGQDGPYRLQPAHDLNFLALSGALGLIGETGTMPSIPLNLVADNGGAALHGALAILFALFARERGSGGQHLDISYLDATVALLAATPNLRRYFSSGHTPRQGDGVFCGAYPYYTTYETRDDRHLTVACSEPWLWEKFCHAIGHPEFVCFARDPAHYGRSPTQEEAEARAAIARVMRTRDRDDWNERLIAADACVGKVLDVDEMTRDPQVLARSMVIGIEHEEWGTVRQFGSPFKLSETPPQPRRVAPWPGQDTDEILREAGLSSEEIDGLRSSRIVE